MTEEEKKFKILKIERLESAIIEYDKKILFWSMFFGLNFLSVLLYLTNKNFFEIHMFLKIIATSCTICSFADLVMLIIYIAKKIGLEKSIYEIKAELYAYEQLEREGKFR